MRGEGETIDDLKELMRQQMVAAREERLMAMMVAAPVMHCAHFSFDLLGPHKGFLDLTECAHVHEFRKNLLTEFTVYLKIG